MGAYRAFGLVVESSVPLATSPAVGCADCVLRVPRGGVGRGRTGPRRAIRLPGGAISLTVARSGSGYLVGFPGLADFEVSRDGREVAAAARRRTPRDVVAHLFLSQVMPLALSRQGRIVLHASAVAAPGGAVAFVGTTGQGKSTLCASFARSGFPVLADDSLLLVERGHGLAAVPSYPEIRLWPDTLAALDGEGVKARAAAHPAGKKRLGLGGGPWSFSRRPVPLRRAYVLGAPDPTDPSGQVSITTLPPREAFMELVKHSYRLEFDDPARLRSEFESIGGVVSRVGFYRLSVPRDLRRLPAVRTAILEHLER